MPFNGAGVYEIVPYQAPKLSLNSWGGGTSPGEKVKAGGRSKPPGQNTKWQMAVAKGSGDSAEYLIINSRSGYFLKATDERTIVSCQQMDPSDATVRWKVTKAFTHGYDVWTINSVAGRGQLNMSGSGQTEGTEVLVWDIENGDNSKFYFDPA